MKVKKETKKDREKRWMKEFFKKGKENPEAAKGLMELMGLCLERFRKMKNVEHLSRSQGSKKFGHFFAKVMKAIMEQNDEEIWKLLFKGHEEIWQIAKASLKKTKANGNGK